jgi:hypothetical protein
VERTRQVEKLLGFSLVRVDRLLKNGLNLIKVPFSFFEALALAYLR